VSWFFLYREIYVWHHVTPSFHLNPPPQRPGLPPPRPGIFLISVISSVSGRTDHLLRARRRRPPSEANHSSKDSWIEPDKFSIQVNWVNPCGVRQAKRSICVALYANICNFSACADFRGRQRPATYAACSCPC